MRLELLRYDQKLKDDKQGMLLMEARAWKQVAWGTRLPGARESGGRGFVCRGLDGNRQGMLLMEARAWKRLG